MTETLLPSYRGYDLPFFDSDGRQVVFSKSSLDALQKCKRYYFYTMLQGWKARHQSVDLVFGGLLASAVELYYTRREVEDSHEALITVVHEVLKASYGLPVFQTERLKTRRALIAALVQYFDTYAEIDEPHIHKLEAPIVLPITDDITFVTRLDIVKNMEDEYQVLDQKTTKSSLSTAYFDNYTPDNQMSLQIYAGRTYFSKPVRNVIVDAVSIQKTQITFLRGVVSRTTKQLEDWASGIVQEIYDVWRRDPKDESAWPQNPTACGYFRGCEFRDVCSQDPALRPAYLKKGFARDE